MGQFRLTLLAQEDMDSIGTYTVTTWGLNQAIKYLTELDATFETLAQNPSIGKDRSTLKPDVISYPCNKHIVFYRRNDADGIDVLRILHQSMDFERHL